MCANEAHNGKKETKKKDKNQHFRARFVVFREQYSAALIFVGPAVVAKGKKEANIDSTQKFPPFSPVRVFFFPSLFFLSVWGDVRQECLVSPPRTLFLSFFERPFYLSLSLKHTRTQSAKVTNTAEEDEGGEGTEKL